MKNKIFIILLTTKIPFVLNKLLETHTHTHKTKNKNTKMNSGLVDLFGDCDDSPTPQSSSDKDESSSYLPPEVERGNIEYKLKLIDPSPTRFEHLVTQMKWYKNQIH